MSRLLSFLLLIVLVGCTQRSSETEVFQDRRDNVLNVHDKVTEIDLGDILLSNFADPYILGDYLIITDYKSFDKLIYIFDKNSFRFLASTGDRGQGPKEITNMGRLAMDETNHSFHVIDHGKQKIYEFQMDSVLTNPEYLPIEKFTMNEKLYPSYYYYMNDSLAVGLFSQIMSDSDYRPVVGKWNTKTGEIDLMDYRGHPEIIRKRADFAVSFENDLYVECYWHHDLMTIGSISGGFKRNIYGRKWNNEYSNKDLHYDHVIITKDRILASYLGEERFFQKADGEISTYDPTQFLVFDLGGNYLQTLDVGIGVQVICYDKENHRIIMTSDDDRLINYLDLDGILE